MIHQTRRETSNPTTQNLTGPVAAVALPAWRAFRPADPGGTRHVGLAFDAGAFMPRREIGPPLAAAAHAGGTPSLEARRIWCVFQFSRSAPASAAHGRAENVAIPGDEEVIG